MALTEYQKKRDFRKTPEPQGKSRKGKRKQPLFVIQKHAASRLHYDFRLEMDGVLKSWAVPKGPSLDPSEKQLAIHVEDHPLEYGDFEGIIPEGEYGGGTVMVWDQGTWEPQEDAEQGYRGGKLKFLLHGEKLHGGWALVQMHGKAGDGGKNWLLIKEHDDESDSKTDIRETESRSVLSGRSLEEIAAAEDAVWSSDGKSKSSSRASRKKSSGPSGSKSSQSPEFDITKLAGAKKSKQPTSLLPQLATLSSKAPESDDWLHEMKFDGYRLVAFIEDGSVRLKTRNEKDWTKRFPTIVDELKQFPLAQGVLDGEVVVLKPNGIPDFQKLQNQLKSGETEHLVYYAFDVPYAGGYDLRSIPLVQRKEVLRQILEQRNADNSGPVRYSEHILGQGPDVLEDACRHGMEGIISKRSDSYYESRRSRTWLKTKCLKRQEFVIGGYTEPSGSRTGFGSLLLGYYDDGKLIYCGRVGTGFTDQSLSDLARRLKTLKRKTTPYETIPRDAKKDLGNWVSPELVAEVEFTEWTSDGALRHPSFKGLRSDKSPRDVTREEPQVSPSTKPSGSSRSHNNGHSSRQRKSASQVAGVSLTHPDRVLYPSLGLTKQELAEYYVDIADWILPHVVDRPLTLVRCPQGQSKECFYQKHLEHDLPAGLTAVSIEEKRKTSDYAVVQNVTGLVSLVQMGVLEIHPWGARTDDIERPDRVVFDLDPGEGVDWEQVVTATGAVKKKLDDLGLESFLRTSGGKGLHVVVPLVRRQSWENVKAFAHAIATQLTAEDPDHYIDTLSKQKRKGRVFVDYLRNSRGATAVASYSTRAREGAPVATPLRWDELTESLAPNQYTVHNLRKRLSSLKGDPWDGFFDSRQSITAKMLKQLGIDS